MEYIFDRNNVDELLSNLKDDDVVKILGEDLINLLGVNSTQKGRKPIEIDAALFDETFDLWVSGKITARQAMEKLNLKPNTFYRRIKERKENMKDIKSEIKETIKVEKDNLDELKMQVRQDARDVIAKADEAIDNTISRRHMEKEILHEKIAAEIGQKLDEREMKSVVDKERKAQKDSVK